MGAPFEGGWEAVTGAMYPGVGGGETLWLLISVAICVIAIIAGGKHEADSYRKVD